MRRSANLLQSFLPKLKNLHSSYQPLFRMKEIKHLLLAGTGNVWPISLPKNSKPGCGAPITKRIIFYSPPSPRYEAGMLPILNGLSQSVGSHLKQLVEPRLDPTPYYIFSSMESVAFLHPHATSSGTPSLACYSHIRIASFWTAFSANLRELSIAIGNVDSLRLILPQGSLLLPKLEVMRLAYLNNGPISMSDPTPSLRRVAELYRNELLRELKLYVVYQLEESQLLPLIAETLLSSDHLFPQLRTFWIGTDSGRYMPFSQADAISTFIQAHVKTLRSIGVHMFSRVALDLCNSTPSFPLPPTISFASTKGILQLLTPCLITRSVVELELSGSHLELPPPELYPNLKRLTIMVYELDTRTLEIVAERFSDLLSLEVRLQSQNANPKSVQLQSGSASSTVLVSWQLKDFTFWVSGSPQPDYPVMLSVQQLIPSIESFAGRGDMAERWENWEHAWVWPKNVYLDPIMDGTDDSP
ncbi:hypothetical protein DL96DRAFT_1064233 [Flagelloscypha sp. PMI_526]|nr:hypothetical protein DL96DRAFT_1064233 [Flagelloscypha sp. PMI_526]